MQGLAQGGVEVGHIPTGDSLVGGISWDLTIPCIDHTSSTNRACENEMGLGPLKARGCPKGGMQQDRLRLHGMSALSGRARVLVRRAPVKWKTCSSQSTGGGGGKGATERGLQPVR